jgi:hypothetical protein
MLQALVVGTPMNNPQPRINSHSICSATETHYFDCRVAFQAWLKTGRFEVAMLGTPINNPQPHINSHSICSAAETHHFDRRVAF